MIALLPIARFKVTYGTASGRPQTDLERLILNALAVGHGSLEALEEMFVVHRRLLIQCLVSLIQDGLAALGDQGTYVPTADGVRVASGEATGERAVVSPVRSTAVTMERVTGLLAPSREVRFVGGQELRGVDEASLHIPASVHDIRLDEGQVRHLLPRPPGSWIRFVDEVRLISKGAQWLPVLADLKTDTVTGMPDRWRRTLDPLILAHTADRGVTGGDPRSLFTTIAGPQRGEPRTDDLPGNSWAIAPDLASVCRERDALSRTLELALSGDADSVLLSVSSLNTADIDRWEPVLAAALARDVSVDILWGFPPVTTYPRASRSSFTTIAQVVFGSIDSRRTTFQTPSSALGQKVPRSQSRRAHS